MLIFKKDTELLNEYLLHNAPEICTYPTCNLCSEEILELIKYELGISDLSTVLIEVDSEIIGLYSIKELAWESEIFKKNMGGVQFYLSNSVLKITEEIIDRIITSSKEKKMEWLSFKVNTKFEYVVEFLTESNIKCYDTLVRYRIEKKELNKNIDLNNQLKLRESTSEDYEELKAITMESFNNYKNRYYRDPFIKDENIALMYLDWMHNSLNGYADYFNICEENKKMLGFSTSKDSFICNSKIKITNGGLAAVLKSQCGRGIHKTMLIDRIKKSFIKCDYFEVGTQLTNIASQRNMVFVGMKPFQSLSIFHLEVNNDL
jgi:hypothetical protein